MENCQRCLKNKSSFQCTECPSFNSLCTRCDKIIHNIASKQNHRRILLGQLPILNNKEIKDEKNLINSELNQIHLSNIEIENENENENEIMNQSKQNSLYIEQNNNIINNIDSKNNLLISHNSKNINEIINAEDKNKEILIQQKQNTPEKKDKSKDIINQVSIFNSNLLIKDKYSKEYVNEIKKVFRKEKEFLEYKNKTLQYSLDKIKLEFTDQINTISKELEDIQSNNIININALKENYETKIRDLGTSHNAEIQSYSEKIFQLEKELNEIKQNYNKEINEKNIVIKDLQNENERLEQEINKKNEELIKNKNAFEIMNKQYEKEFGEEKNRIINEYELRIQEIVQNVENTKNNLVNLIEQREFDMKNILDEKNSEILKLNEINKVMKEELESHKMNLINIKNNKENLYKENQKLKNEVHKLDCDTQLQVNEIMRIQQENQALYEENSKLKLELNKLDNIIYSNNNNENN